jgi:hypothetical protein
MSSKLNFASLFNSPFIAAILYLNYQMKFIKRTQRFISDYLPIKVSKEDIRFIVIFLFFIFAVIFLVSFIEYHRQKF